MILNYLPISACSGLLKFDMKMFVNIARLDIGQLFTQSVRREHPCTLDTFLVFSQHGLCLWRLAIWAWYIAIKSLYYCMIEIFMCKSSTY